VYFRQTFHGLDVNNVKINANVDKKGEVFFGNSLIADIAGRFDAGPPLTSISSSEAFDSATGQLGLMIGETLVPK